MRSLLVLLLTTGCVPAETSDDAKDSGEVYDVDGDGHTGSDDCNEEDGTVYAGAAELCDELDNDCDGKVDEDAENAVLSYVDADGDGYGDSGQPVEACGVPEGNAAEGGDCDDSSAAYNPAAEEDDCGDPADYNCDGSVGYADADGDGSAACYDCNDGDASVNPDAAESCNGVDDDCDGLVDVGAADGTVWYLDDDGDGYGGASTIIACDQPSGYQQYGGDCDDGNTAYNPGAVEVDCADPNDYNCDGSVGYDDADGDGFAACEECNDADVETFPGAAEFCNLKDDDCDGDIDEGDAVDSSVWYSDADGDNFGDAGTTQTACDQPAGYVVDATDCDDSDAAENPSALEVCDGDDDNCDGVVDEATAADAPSWYADVDTDGFGDPATAVVGCEGPSGYIAAGDDCDDTDAAVYPGAAEYCNAYDDDCDGTVDEDDAIDASAWYADSDADGYGDPTAVTMACDAPAGTVADRQDCDDTAASVNPAGTEECNGVDDNCDGDIDEGVSEGAPTWYADSDGDGYGDPAVGLPACEMPAGYSAFDTDCDDADGAEYPGASEICDGDDDNCDGEVDEDAAIDAVTWFVDGDSDGYGSAATTEVDCDAPAGFAASSNDCDDAQAAINPGAAEVCDEGNTDEDCSGAADDADAGASGQTSWYRDLDTDGYGSSSSASACDQPAGYVAVSGDCNDVIFGINPGATEVCDASNTDEDCSGAADDLDGAATGTSTFYVDSDADGYGGSSTTTACDLPSGHAAVGGDCNDSASAVNPAATEVCDAANTDENCNGTADDLDSGATGESTFYADADGDGYGSTTTTSACDAPSGYAAVGGDCNDGASSVNPGASEVCDSADVDEDCSGAADDDDAAVTGTTTWYRDLDTDGYGSTSSTAACDQPSGYVATSGDCNDVISGINPGATEVCDASNTDENCNGTADDLDTAATGKSTWYRDADSDAYGTSATTTSACDVPSGYVSVSGDCNDSVSGVNPGATEVCDASNTDEDCDGTADDLDGSATGKSTFYADADSDGYGTTTTTSACDAPSGYATAGGDCNDSASGVNPGADEVCDAADVDEDCSGAADDSDAGVTGTTTWYLDLDADLYGGSTSTSACNQPSGYIALGGDCNDSDGSINPSAAEVCDALDVDEDCSGAADDDDAGATGQSSFYADVDSDSYGDAAVGISACDMPSGYDASSTDCDDSDAAVYPGAAEYCDGADNNCDGEIDEDAALDVSTWYRDADADGYGISTTSTVDCDQPSGYVANTGDCNDSESAAYTGASDVCDEIDNDCDGTVDEDSTASTWYADVDGDTYGDAATSLSACAAPAGYVADATDCDDTESTANPAGTEVCDDGIDQNCEVDCRDEELLDASTGTTFTGVNGTTSTSSFGSHLVGNADFNGDGYPDFAVGDRLYDVTTTNSNMGRVTIFLGTAAGYTDTVANPSITITGNDSAGRFGQGLAFGDIDGDGFDDLIAGTPAINGLAGGSTSLTDNGKAAVYLGPFDRTSGATTALLNTTAADCVVEGAAARSYLGSSLAFSSDLSGDGSPDWVYGAPQAYSTSGTSAGYVGIVSTGSCTARTSASASTITITGLSGDTFGFSVMGDLDVNADGNDDLVVAGAAPDSAFLFLGPVVAGTRTDADATITSLDFSYSSSSFEDNHGDRFADVGDTDGDGYDEFLIGVNSYDVGTNTNAGAVFLIPGDTLSATSSATGASLASLAVYGGSTTYNLGAGVGYAGDVDGDGSGDYLIGVGAETVATSIYGAGLLFYGGATGSYSPSVTGSISDFAVYTLNTTTSTTAWSGTGGAGTGLGDVDGDGFDDFMFANMNYGTTRVGRTYLVYGTGE